MSFIIMIKCVSCAEALNATDCIWDSGLNKADVEHHFLRQIESINISNYPGLQKSISPTTYYIYELELQTLGFGVDP